LPILLDVEPTLLPTPLGGALEEELIARPGSMTLVNEGPRRIAYCECGAQLVGESDLALFDAMQRHLAHNHPQLLGALEPELVGQMAEDVGLETPHGVRGQST